MMSDANLDPDNGPAPTQESQGQASPGMTTKEDGSAAQNCMATDGESSVIDERTISSQPSGQFANLDPRSVSLSRFTNGITCMILGAIVLLAGSLILWLVPSPLRLIVLLVWTVLAAAFALYVVWLPRWVHNSWSYRVGEKVLELRYGIVWRVSAAIPITRLQHIDLHNGPLERRWGLASLEIHTAGTRDASHRIPGLDVDVANELRDELIVATNRGANDQSPK